MAVLMRSTNSSTLYRAPYTVASRGDVSRGVDGAPARGRGAGAAAGASKVRPRGARGTTVTWQVDEPRASNQSALVHDRLIVSISALHHFNIHISRKFLTLESLLYRIPGPNRKYDFHCFL